MVIDEKIASEVGLEAAAVYSEMILILCTGECTEKSLKDVELNKCLTPFSFR